MTDVAAPLRVLFVTFAVPGGTGQSRTGPGTYLENSIRALRSCGADAHVLWFSDEPFAESATAGLDGVPVFRVYLPWRLFVSGWFPGLTEGWTLASTAKALDRIHHYDVIEGPNWSGICWALALRFPRKFWLRLFTSVVDARGGAAAPPGWRPKFRRWLDRFATRRSRNRITHSTAHAQHSREEYGLDHDAAIAVVPLGIDDPGTVVPPIAGSTILSFGGIDLRKGNDLVVRAFAEVVGEFPDASLSIVGKPPADIPKWLGSHGSDVAAVADRIRFAGIVGDAELNEIWATSTIVVVASRYESFGLVAAEAMARQLPLISSDGGALPEVVGDGGLIFQLSEPASLAAAFRRFLSTPSIARDHAARGRRRFENRYTLHQTGHAAASAYTAGVHS